MLVQKHVSEQEVLLDFATNINNFCEQYHKESEIPRTFICKFMIEKFHGRVGHSDDWIRKRIDPTFKNFAKSSNAKKRQLSKIDRLKSALSIAEKNLLEDTHETTITIGKDL